MSGVTLVKTVGATQKPLAGAEAGRPPPVRTCGANRSAHGCDVTKIRCDVTGGGCDVTCDVTGVGCDVT
eukprot:364988-Rhodomonas_salina.2